MKNPFKSYDEYVIQWFNKKIRHKTLDAFFYGVTYLAGPTFLTVSSVLALLFTKGFARRVVMEIVLALVVSGGIVQILKKVFSRNRPYWILKELNTLGIDLTDYSFPSGHTTASFSLGTVMALNFPQYAVIFLLYGCIIGISRIYLAVHYPTDVVAGLLIGIFSSLLVHWKIFPVLVPYALL